MSNESKKIIFAIILIIALSAGLLVISWFFTKEVQYSIEFGIEEQLRSQGIFISVHEVTRPAVTKLYSQLAWVLALFMIYTLGVVYVLFRENKFLKTQQEFLAMVSHQLGTPLVAVRNGFEHITRNLPNTNLISELHIKIENAISLVNNFLFFLDASARSVPISKEHILLPKLIRQIKSRLDKKIENKDIKVVIDVEAEDIEVLGDTRMFEQIFYALLDNAIVYNKKSGTIQIIVKKHNHQARVTIKDTGIGIPIGEQGNIFHKFFRTSNASLGKNEGSGVSLFLTKRTINAYGGTIKFKSKEGEGSLFITTLPLT
jgi:two-component system, sensor histidine kinase and response regulator